MKNADKVLITGGAGFIGSHLCEKLISKGYKVYCVDNLITGKRENISHLENNPQFRFVNHDVINPLPQTLISQLCVLKYVFHLASPASPFWYRKYSIETLKVNSIGTYQVLELARKNNAVFLLASTSEVYGDPLEHPQKETYFGNVNPIGVRSCYDESKRFAESITCEYFRKFNLKTRIARIFNTYGPRMNPDDGRVISNFITQALRNEPLTLYGSGSQTRSFCYISDMVKGILKAAIKDGIDGEVINLGNPQEITIYQVGKKIIELTNSSSKLITTRPMDKDDPERRKPDIKKAKKLLSWKPSIPLYKGLKKTISYFSGLK